MARKVKPRKKPTAASRLPLVNVEDKSAPYTLFSNNIATKRLALQNYDNTVASFTCAATGDSELVTDIRTRKQFSRMDYDSFRPAEQIPRVFKNIVKSVRSMYYQNGQVRQVIDLLTDFACENLRFLHPDVKQRVFYESWAKKVNLNEIINEFARHLLVDANAVIKRTTAKISRPVEKRMTSKTTAAPDLRPNVEKRQVEKREIPWRYNFIDVVATDWMGGIPGIMTGKRQLAFKLHQDVITLIRKRNKTKAEKEIINNMPQDIIKEVKAGKSNVALLDMNKIHVSHYKKDDWQKWSIPFLYSVFPDVSFRNKLRQAEISALDGVINVIRLWKLGSHKEGFLPNSTAVEKLVNILETNTGGGAIDIVWDDMIDMQDYYPPVKDILGSDKYEQVSKDILIGLGVPEVLIGGKGANFSNAFIQLKTVIERLQYIRGKITKWLEEEITLIAEAMGFDTIPKIRFDEMNLRDEGVEKRLIIGLLDRGIISPEAVLEVYGQDFSIEFDRIVKQKKQFDDADIEVKGPFSEDEPQMPDGRPPIKKDLTKRKEKTVKPREAGLSHIFIQDAIDNFDKHVVPAYMEAKGIENARQLTSEARDEINSLRMHVLSSLEYGDDISGEGLLSMMPDRMPVKEHILASIQETIDNFIATRGKNPTISQLKRLEALGWTKTQGESNA